MGKSHELISVLKADVFGRMELCRHESRGLFLRRVTRYSRWWLRPLARHFARRERRALEVLDGVPGIPRLLGWSGDVLERSWIEGQPLYEARPVGRVEYFRACFRLLVALHRRGVAHNDLAKEPNWLVCEDGSPAIVDFQLAACSRRRGKLFRVMAREDLRHMLKHKRSYCPEALRPREKSMLARKNLPARLWMASGKKLYNLVTRRILGWADREGAGDRNLRSR